MILAKINVEQGRPICARLFLQRAERIAREAGNRVNFGDIKMVWGFWHQEFGSTENLIQTLADAMVVFSTINNFDLRQKAEYMSRSFPEVWPEVRRLVKSTRTR
jgi:hypothetical protein